mmetsp:Transcript_32791/g.78320  ORF Transcript_32791/g.78320 Transcript_32791/m.78320 type:complete len:237 (-) Transcript_32791:1436-2146(-)
MVRVSSSTTSSVSRPKYYLTTSTARSSLASRVVSSDGPTSASPAVRSSAHITTRTSLGTGPNSCSICATRMTRASRRPRRRRRPRWRWVTTMSKNRTASRTGLRAVTKKERTAIMSKRRRRTRIRRATTTVRCRTVTRGARIWPRQTPRLIMTAPRLMQWLGSKRTTAILQQSRPTKARWKPPSRANQRRRSPRTTSRPRPSLLQATSPRRHASPRWCQSYPRSIPGTAHPSRRNK